MNPAGLTSPTPASLTISFDSRGDISMPALAQWHVFEDRLYNLLPGVNAQVIINVNRKVLNQRDIFDSLSRDILDNKFLPWLWSDQRLDAQYDLPVSQKFPYRHRRTSVSPISLREVLKYPENHTIDGRSLSLSFSQKLDLILSESVGKGRAVLLSAAENVNPS